MNRITIARKALGLKQGPFAEKLGYTQSHVSDIESGRAAVSDKIIKRIVAVYPIREEFLRDGEGEPLRPKITIGECICALIRALTEEERADVVEKLKEFLPLESGKGEE